MKLWHRKKASPANPPRIKAARAYIDWPDALKRAAFAETQIFPSAARALIHGIDPVGHVFATIIASSSERIDFAADPDHANALILGFTGPEVEQWQKAFPEKTVVAMIDRNDERFAGRWVVLPWEVHHHIDRKE